MEKKQRKVEQTKETKQCRICLSENEKDIVSPCHCKGSVKYVHKECLQKWVDVKGVLNCDLCKKKYNVKLKLEEENKVFARFLLVANIFFLVAPISQKPMKIDIVVFGNKGVDKTPLIENMKTYLKYNKEHSEINYFEKNNPRRSREFFIHLKRFKSLKNTSILLWNADELSVCCFKY
jgi:hypothetical protein